MRELDPKQTKRAQAFELWMTAPMPMVTVFKTLDVTNILKISKKRGLKLNMLLCYLIGKAASQIEEFYLLPVEQKLFQYDKLAINVVVNTKDGGINNCDIPFSEDVERFNEDYLNITAKTHETCQTYPAGDQYAIVGTSTVVETELDGVVNLYSGFYNNPFMVWSRYKKKFFKTTLAVSLQFHHSQMDGSHVAKFLEALQAEIKNLKI